MALFKEALPQALCPPTSTKSGLSLQNSAICLCVPVCVPLLSSQLSLSPWECLQTEVLHLALHLKGKVHQLLSSLSSTEVVLVQSQGAPLSERALLHSQALH